MMDKNCKKEKLEKDYESKRREIISFMENNIDPVLLQEIEKAYSFSFPETSTLQFNITTEGALDASEK